MSMLSDNAGCFVKGKKISEADRAERILAHQSLVTGTKKMQAFAANYNLEWHFAPARSPHFNGIVEVAVSIQSDITVSIFDACDFNSDHKQFLRHSHLTVGLNCRTIGL